MQASSPSPPSVGDAPPLLYHGTSRAIDGAALLPRASALLDGEPAVFAAADYALAVVFAARAPGADVGVGHVNGRLYVQENSAGAFARHLRGAAGYIYTVAGATFGGDARLGMPHSEFISRAPVPVAAAPARIDDVYAWLAAARADVTLIPHTERDPSQN